MRRNLNELQTNLQQLFCNNVRKRNEDGVGVSVQLYCAVTMRVYNLNPENNCASLSGHKVRLNVNFFYKIRRFICRFAWISDLINYTETTGIRKAINTSEDKQAHKKGEERTKCKKYIVKK